MIKLKVGRNILNITEDDLILDNGSCYQIITQRIGYGFNKDVPMMSKRLFNELRKIGLVFTNDELSRKAQKMYHSTPITLYKFDIDRMKKYGY